MHQAFECHKKLKLDCEMMMKFFFFFFLLSSADIVRPNVARQFDNEPINKLSIEHHQQVFANTCMTLPFFFISFCCVFFPFSTQEAIIFLALPRTNEFVNFNEIFWFFCFFPCHDSLCHSNSSTSNQNRLDEKDKVRVEHNRKVVCGRQSIRVRYERAVTMRLSVGLFALLVLLLVAQSSRGVDLNDGELSVHDSLQPKKSIEIARVRREETEDDSDDKSDGDEPANDDKAKLKESAPDEDADDAVADMKAADSAPGAAGESKMAELKESAESMSTEPSDATEEAPRVEKSKAAKRVNWTEIESEWNAVLDDDKVREKWNKIDEKMKAGKLRFVDDDEDFILIDALEQEFDRCFDPSFRKWWP